MATLPHPARLRRLARHTTPAGTNQTGRGVQANAELRFRLRQPLWGRRLRSYAMDDTQRLQRATAAVVAGGNSNHVGRPATYRGWWPGHAPACTTVWCDYLPRSVRQCTCPGYIPRAAATSDSALPTRWSAHAFGRRVAARLGQELGQPVVVEQQNPRSARWACWRCCAHARTDTRWCSAVPHPRALPADLRQAAIRSGGGFVPVALVGANTVCFMARNGVATDLPGLLAEARRLPGQLASAPPAPALSCIWRGSTYSTPPAGWRCCMCRIAVTVRRWWICWRATSTRWQTPS